ncbi:hypothetical protein [Spirosoma linguale]|uniref:Uncharacterized protein n=1 Tax=Spirosoma linguale (strain ATCC 33905 / DSM 74 / LMG 10896 / Claus 1) TaxID=504472 RepID=D2QC18_SPILD|nr:hypothetical protein Slin_3757 [Spirosoma linguale DSM 74]
MNIGRDEADILKVRNSVRFIHFMCGEPPPFSSFTGQGPSS